MWISAAYVLLALLQPPLPVPLPPAGPPDAPIPPPGATFDTADEEILQENKIPTDGPGLLAFFRQRVVRAADEDRIKALVRQLGDDDFDRREDASLQLDAFGLRARPFLLSAVRDPDVEVAHRARACLRDIDGGSTSTSTAAAVRVLAKLKPDGAAAALLAYLPAAGDDSVAEEVRLALSELAVRDGKADPVLSDALSDPSALKRAAAAFALGSARTADQLPAVRKLLKDADPVVRYRAALALASARDKDAVPVLIDLLTELPRLEASRVEELLYRVADDKAPPAPASLNAAARGKFRDAWKAWWDDKGGKVDLNRLEEAARTVGYTLVVLLDQGRVLELDAANRPRLQVDQLSFPLDAQILPGDHVLVAEHNGGRVTERNGKNEVVWEKRVEGPLVAQRLPNGNTFIATRGQLIEVKPDNTEVFTYDRPNGDTIMKALKLHNGDIALVTQLGAGVGMARFVLLNAKGKELRTFNVNLRYSGGRIDVLPDGNVLVPETDANRVVELDSHGAVVWEVGMEQPIAAVRLANGDTLITSYSDHRAVEVDRDGKEVWQYRQDTRVTRAFRR